MVSSLWKRKVGEERGEEPAVASRICCRRVSGFVDGEIGKWVLRQRSSTACRSGAPRWEVGEGGEVSVAGEQREQSQSQRTRVPRHTRRATIRLGQRLGYWLDWRNAACGLAGFAPLFAAEPKPSRHERLGASRYWPQLHLYRHSSYHGTVCGRLRTVATRPIWTEARLFAYWFSSSQAGRLRGEP